MWKILLPCILITLTEGNIVHGSEDDFPHKVETLLDELNRNYSMKDTIKKALGKLQEIEFDTWSETKKSAALIINIFTSSDFISTKPEMTFYGMLQKQLRSGHPDEIWKRCEDLLNDALQIIGVEIFDHLYRGEREWQVLFQDEGQTYFVASFWSTTLDPVITGDFGGKKGFFYHILGAKGVRVENISVIYKEKEVLLPSGISYTVVRVLRNVTEIRKELNKISKSNSGADLSTFKPKVLVVLSGETYYIGMNNTTEPTTQYNATESEANLISTENSSGYKSLQEFNFYDIIFLLVVFIYLFKYLLIVFVHLIS